MNEPAKPSDIYGGAIFVRHKKDVPQVEHWAIIKFKRISVPGYDKGDPPDWEDVCEYEAYLTRELWEAAIQKLEEKKYSPEEYVAVKVSKPAKTTIKIEVSE